MSKLVTGAIFGGLLGAGAAAYRSYLNDEPVDELATKAATTAGAGAAAGALIGLVLDRRCKSRASNAAVLLGYAAAQKDRLAAASVKGNKRAQRKAAKAQKRAAKQVAHYEKELAQNVAMLNANAAKKIAKARKNSPAFDATYNAATAAAGAATPVVRGWMKRAQPIVSSSRNTVTHLIGEGAPVAKNAYETTVSAAVPFAHKSAERAGDALESLTPLAKEAADRAAKQYYRSSEQAVKFAKQTAKKTAKNSKPYIENAKEWANEARSEAAKAAAEREKRKPIVVKVG